MAFWGCRYNCSDKEASWAALGGHIPWGQKVANRVPSADEYFGFVAAQHHCFIRRDFNITVHFHHICVIICIIENNKKRQVFNYFHTHPALDPKRLLCASIVRTHTRHFPSLPWPLSFSAPLMHLYTIKSKFMCCKQAHSHRGAEKGSTPPEICTIPLLSLQCSSNPPSNLPNFRGEKEGCWVGPRSRAGGHRSLLSFPSG